MWPFGVHYGRTFCNTYTQMDIQALQISAVSAQGECWQDVKQSPHKGTGAHREGVGAFQTVLKMRNMMNIHHSGSQVTKVYT